MPPAKSLGFAWNGKKVPAARALPGLLSDEDPDPHGVGAFLQAKAAEREAAGARPGTGISPQVEALAAPAETLMDLGLTLAEKRLPGAEDAQGSMIPTRKNIGKFIQKMLEAPVRVDRITHPEITYAKAFMDARYPIRSQRGVRDARVYPQRNKPEAAGFYNTHNMRSYIASKRGEPARESLLTPGTWYNPKDNIEDSINTLSHEAQHHLDYTRAASPADPLEFYTKERHPEGKYIPYDKVKHNYDEYRNQRIEKRAFAAGDTAREAHNKFIRVLQSMTPEQQRIYNWRLKDSFWTGVK